MRSTVPQALYFDAGGDALEIFRKLVCWVIAVLVILLMNAHPVAAAESASQYCKEEKPSELGPGNWEGTFEQVITATLGEKEVSGDYTWTLKGTLKKFYQPRIRVKKPVIISTGKSARSNFVPGCGQVRLN
jgi:hypothetical protein